MTTKRIIYTRPGGGVSVVTPSPNRIAQLVSEGMTEAEAIDVVKAKSVPAGSINVVVTEAASLLTDRTFRNAWVRAGPGLPVVDMPKARGIHSARIAQAKVLAIGAFAKAEETATLASDSAAAADALANLTAAQGLDVALTASQIAAAATPAALKALWPAELKDFKPF